MAKPPSPLKGIAPAAKKAGRDFAARLIDDVRIVEAAATHLSELLAIYSDTANEGWRRTIHSLERLEVELKPHHNLQGSMTHTAIDNNLACLVVDANGIASHAELPPLDDEETAPAPRYLAHGLLHIGLKGIPEASVNLSVGWIGGMAKGPRNLFFLIGNRDGKGEDPVLMIMPTIAHGGVSMGDLHLARGGTLSTLTERQSGLFTLLNETILYLIGNHRAESSVETALKMSSILVPQRSATAHKPVHGEIDATIDGEEAARNAASELTHHTRTFEEYTGYVEMGLREAINHFRDTVNLKWRDTGVRISDMNIRMEYGVDEQNPATAGALHPDTHGRERHLANGILEIHITDAPPLHINISLLHFIGSNPHDQQIIMALGNRNGDAYDPHVFILDVTKDKPKSFAAVHLAEGALASHLDAPVDNNPRITLFDYFADRISDLVLTQRKAATQATPRDPA